MLLPSEGAEQSPAEDWLDNLTTPGRRLGAFAVGIAGLIVLVTMSPVAIAAAVVLLGAAALLAPTRPAAAVDASPTNPEQE